MLLVPVSMMFSPYVSAEKIISVYGDEFYLLGEELFTLITVFSQYDLSIQ